MGWLNTLGFYDFAGSTLVHAVGGWGALAGAMILGPRVGKYIGKKIKPIPGHSMPLATIGVFMLWLGWFGFNGGSVLNADAAAVSLTLVTTSLAAAGPRIRSLDSEPGVDREPAVDDQLRAASVFAACRKGLEANFVPSYLQVVDEIPKTASEKPQERFLVERFERDPASVFTEPRA